MKNVFLKAATLALAMTALGHADAPASSTQKTNGKKESSFIQYNNRMAVFGVCHQVYERTKNDALYAGVEAFAAPILNKDNRALFDAEFRMGYNFFYNGKDHVTPFAGVGYFGEYRDHHHHWSADRDGVVYGTLGALYTHEFNTIFNLGLNAKLLLGGPVNHKHLHWGSPVVGTDIAVPITFRFGHLRHWDLRVEPFNTYLHGSDASQDYWGFRSTLGYRF